MSLILWESSLFDAIGGLPLHPLVVHAAVVLLPLSALGLVAEVLVPALRRRYAGLTVLGLLVGTGAAFVAKESGEALARANELPKDHAFWGGVLPWVSLVLLAAAGAWYFLGRRAEKSETRSPGVAISGAVTAVLAVAVLALTVIVGHSGATAVWEEPAAPAEPAPSASVASASPSVSAPASPSASATTPSASPSAPASVTPSATPTTNALTMANVKQHNSAASCWSVVDGNVYDLTTWIPRHKGGQQRILSMCGVDATGAFRAEHGTAGLANTTLAGFKLGALAH